MTTHALIVPWPLSAGLRTWCALDAAKAPKEDCVTGSPEVVDCPRCIDAMRRAHANLSEWVPKLRKV